MDSIAETTASSGEPLLNIQKQPFELGELAFDRWHLQPFALPSRVQAGEVLARITQVTAVVNDTAATAASRRGPAP